MTEKRAGHEGWNLDEYPLWHGAMPMGVYARVAGPGKVLVRGDGCFVEDAAGRRLLDGRAGICNMALGYGRSDIARAMYEQAVDLPFACLIRYDRPAAVTVEYARELCAWAPTSLTRVRLTHMGSASTENALLMSRLYHRNRGQERPWFVSLSESFHGTTYLTLGVSGDPVFDQLFGPMPAEIARVPAPYDVACPDCARGSCEVHAFTSLAATVEDIGPERVAAIIVEPVMNDRAVVVGADYLARLRRLSDEYGILLIFDEIVTGFGRVGEMFAADLYGVVPDIMCLAKGITAGYAPMGAVLVNETVYEAFNRPGNLHFPNGSSTDGHPLGCAAALAVLRIFDKEDVVARGRSAARRLRDGLAQVARASDLVHELRGEGLYLGLDIREHDGRPAGLRRMRQIWHACDQRGLLIQVTGNLVIAMPPLVISDDEIDRLVNVLGDALTATAGLDRDHDVLDEIASSATSTSTPLPAPTP